MSDCLPTIRPDCLSEGLDFIRKSFGFRTKRLDCFTKRLDCQISLTVTDVAAKTFSLYDNLRTICLGLQFREFGDSILVIIL